MLLFENVAYAQFVEHAAEFSILAEIPIPYLFVAAAKVSVRGFHLQCLHRHVVKIYNAVAFGVQVVFQCKAVYFHHFGCAADELERPFAFLPVKRYGVVVAAGSRSSA